ncbi:MAG: glycosyl hydrolase [bacterium]|nr:glycosyl hydrolase [bacterium]
MLPFQARRVGLALVKQSNDRRFLVKRFTLLLLAGLLVFPQVGMAAKDKAEDDNGEKSLLSSGTFSALKLREIGPAVTSGRITDFAVNPDNTAEYYVAVASGGVWKTVNNGTTFDPIFDGEGSYSVGCVTIDPNNPATVWVGSGENNSQRAVSFGDGVYKSMDGGASWKNTGLKDSEHIGNIVVDPRDSNVVYVAAHGPLWNEGGHRGLFKTTDGGENWELALEIDEHTGVNEVHMDPRNPDVLIASSYQRARRVWTLIDGGPGSGIHKSTDAGKTWRKVTSGLPTVDMGRIGLAISPADPDVVYAIIEAALGKGGFYRSTNSGETWKRMSDHVAGSPQYYNEIVADPKKVDRVYSLETWMRVTDDGGKTFNMIGSKYRHVDDHAIWIDPKNTDHLIVGCDGGIYESWDRAVTYQFKVNLPVTQFYKIAVDNSEPFYYIYGGTQDNATLGGPTRTTSPMGITNEDWFVTVFGDGFQTRVDPEDPNIVYSEWQYGGLVRHDRRSGEIVDIKPQERPGDEPYRWNWDAPLIISPHSHTRLYFAASRLFRSDDRGNSWQVISDDLSRSIDRNELEIMGKVWNADAVAKSASTSMFGNAVALTESPLVEGLLYVGTDDGLIHVTEDNGTTWRTIEEIKGVPEMTYAARLEADLHDADTIYAAFSNHKNGDFKPYAVKSTDRGQTWSSIAGDLPERGMVWALVQDHVKPELLFAGTEFGVFFTLDGGEKWIQLKNGIPTIAVRDLAIQQRENDLAVGTFGRGFFILDDYTPLRHVSEDVLEQAALVFPVKDALSYIEHSRLGLPLDKAFQGDHFYSAPNPPFGAVFTYYLKDKLMTRKERRHKAEKDAAKAEETAAYPSTDDLRAEVLESDPQILLTVRDDSGAVVKRIKGSRDKGMHRVAWGLRYPTSTPVDLKPGEPSIWGPPDVGPLALPGTYTMTLAQEVDGVVTDLVEPVAFEVVPLNLATFTAEDREAVLAFQQKAARLQRAVHGTLKSAGEAESRIAHLKKAVLETPAVDTATLERVQGFQAEIDRILIALRGDRSLARRNEPTPPSILGRVETIIGGQFHVTSAPTQTNIDGYTYAGEAFTTELANLKALFGDVEALEAELEQAGAPWTPGRLPDWSIE